MLVYIAKAINKNAGLQAPHSEIQKALYHDLEYLFCFYHLALDHQLLHHFLFCIINT